MDFKEARLKLGYTQEQMGELVGLDAPTISKIETGKVLPTASASKIVFKALASRFDEGLGGVSINYSTEQKKSLKTEICASILEALEQTSFEKPITREELKTWCKTNDRYIRQGITDLRKEGYRIGSYSGGRGYWLCHTEEEYQIVRNMYLSKARDMYETVSAMDMSLPGQIGIDDVGQWVDKA